MYFSELERKISVRSTRDELIKKGVIKERVDDAIIEANENQSNATTTTTTTIQADTTTTATSPDTAVVTVQHNHAPSITETGELSPLILINNVLPLEQFDISPYCLCASLNLNLSVIADNIFMPCLDDGTLSDTRVRRSAPPTMLAL